MPITGEEGVERSPGRPAGENAVEAEVGGRHHLACPRATTGEVEPKGGLSVRRRVVVDRPGALQDPPNVGFGLTWAGPLPARAWRVAAAISLAGIVPALALPRPPPLTAAPS
jgi:hypothetical protein